MIITLSGKAGSGKTTIGREVAKRLGYKFYSMGDLRGEIAQRRGITIDELNKIGEKEDWTDKEVDDYQEKLGKKEDNFVVDGWTSFHFIPHSVKIFLDVDLDLAAERIFKNQRPDEKKANSVEEVKKTISNRMKESNERYKKYYSIDIYDLSNYDVVIDSTGMSVEEEIDAVLDYIKKVTN